MKDPEYKKKLTAERIFIAKEKLFALEIDMHYESETELRFMHKGEEIKYFPYSGWHTGKSIIDGRGISTLVDQLKKK